LVFPIRVMPLDFKTLSSVTGPKYAPELGMCSKLWLVNYWFDTTI
jgi:hypothetical protein